MVLRQLAQPTEGADELKVLHIQVDELHVRNARVHLREQARVQNLRHFKEREQDRRQQQPTAAMTATVAHLADTMAGQQQMPPPDAVQQQGAPPPSNADPTEDTHMDMGVTEMDANQGDVVMGDGSGVQADDPETKGAKEA